MQIVPNSWGETPLREYNHCHGPADGRFCSEPTGAPSPLHQRFGRKVPVSPETLAGLTAISTDSTIPDKDKPAKLFEALQARQPKLVAEMQRLLDRGTAAFPEFSEAMSSIAQQLGYQLHTNIESRDILAKDVDWAVVGPVKGVARAAVKAALDYDGDVRQVKDVLRGTIAVRDANSMVTALSKLSETTDIVKVKDHVSRPMDGGYRDLNVIVRMKKSGMLAEVQIITKPMLAAKMGKGHTLYEMARVLPAKSERYLQLAKEQLQLYNTAWSESTKKVAGAAVTAALAVLMARVGGGV